MDYSNIPPEMIARRIAAQSSTNLENAVNAYVQLTGQEILYADAEAEFLNNLPGYRHPVKDEQEERMIFFAEFPTATINCCIGFRIGAKPLSVEEVEQDVQSPLREKIVGHMFLADQTRDDLEAVRAELRRVEAERDELHDLVNFARKEYAPVNQGGNSDKRARRVVAALGLSTGKRQKTYKAADVYSMYVDLVRREGLSRQDAQNRTAETFGLAEDTVSQHLNDRISRIKEEWRLKAAGAWPRYKIYLNRFVLAKGTDWNNR